MMWEVVRLSKTKDENTQDQSYKEIYGYSYDEITKQYDELLEKAKGNPKQIADLNLMFVFSGLYETPMYEYVSNETLRKLINNYIFKDANVSNDKYKSLTYSEKEIDPVKDEHMAKLFRYTEHHYKTLNKRCTDWILRQKEIIKLIQGAIIKLVELNYNPNQQQIEDIQDNLIDAINRYKEGQLDVITMKATQDLLPMFEMELFLNKYTEDIKTLMDHWNYHNDKYSEQHEKGIGYYKTDDLNIADKLYRTKYNLLQSDFYKHISEYSGLFLNSKVLLKIVFIKGGSR